MGNISGCVDSGVKDQQNKVARHIQNQYRIYKHRTGDLNRTSTLIQQLYRRKSFDHSQNMKYFGSDVSHI